MSSIWGRVAAAAILSMSVFGATQYFAERYRPPHHDNEAQKPIAYIQSLNDEVEKRSVTSLVWNEVTQGETLQTGEAVKTSNQGEVRIQFADSSRYIDLDPESLIVLAQEKGNEISLDLLGGSLLVGGSNSTTGPNSELTLTLKSDQGKIDLSQATAQLSKGSGSEVTVQVLQGKAKVESQGKIKEINKDEQLSKIEILSPGLGEAIYLNATNPEPVAFRWKEFAPTARKSVWIGKTRKSLRLVGSTENANESSFKAQLNSGNYFWKITAQDPSTGKTLQESPVYRLKIENRFPPSLVQPTPRAKLTDSHVDFKWLKPEGAQSVQLEISKNPSLQEKVFSKIFTTEENSLQELAPGTYYWRLSATFKETQNPISSPVSSFSVGVPAEIEKPRIPVVISWLNKGSEAPQYFVNSPKASLAWATEQKDQVRNWRLKLAETEDSLKDDKAPLVYRAEIHETQAEAPLPKPGRYLAMVEALDEKNQVLASSPVKALEVTPLPLLHAPEFLPTTGEFRADQLGHLNLKWTNIPGSKEYWLILMDSTGKEIRRARYIGNSTGINNLLPGQYQVSILAVDSYGRESERSSPRVVQVPDKSGLQAPKFKRIQVE